MQILRARPDDAARLTEIAFTSKRHWGYPERWIADWRHLLTIEPKSIVERETYTAYIDEAPVGFYSLSCELSLSRGLSLSWGHSQMTLEHLWVLPEAMRRGVGRALFTHALERARAAGCERLAIESDPNAAGFYERMGARRVATIVTELEGRPRELPVFVYEITPAA